MRTRWVTYKKYSGYVVDGGSEIFVPTDGLHISRAVWLASKLEGSRFGTVQAYDGAGMSGGLLHNIAVSPKDLSQGTFFGLLTRVKAEAPVAFAGSFVGKRMESLNWVVDSGMLLTAKGRMKIPGAMIREEFSGPSGKVPREGSEHQREWAEGFHRLFVHPSTYGAQLRYAAEWLASGNSKMEMDVYRRYSGILDSMIGVKFSSLPPAIDLAMCVYHAFSVNAPSIARACLSAMPTIIDDETKWAKLLIRKLGLRKFANWADEVGDGSNRYDATRKVVWSCGLWDTKLARDLMPKDL